MSPIMRYELAHVRRRLAVALVAIAAVQIPVQVTCASDFDNALRLVLQMNEAAAQSQKKVEKLDEDKADLLSRYRSVTQQLASLNGYNEQAQKLVDAQQAQADELQKQIDDATLIGRGVTPLMARMIEALGAFVELDVPFLLTERRDRVKQLEALMGRPDVTEAEKYRRIMEAYQIENEYGRTIEAYTAELALDGGPARTLEFLRVGRVALVSRTLDSSEMSVWDQKARKWTALGPEYRASIKEGFRIARKQAAPDLFRIPVTAPEVAQ
jgi:cytochrome c-type biogenesis protein CcmH/NrfF